MIGRLIDGRYQVRSRVARGGMATVYLATDLRLERRVALKVMHGHLADDSQYKARFIQEARSAARLAHPNVVNVYDQGQDDETAYLVMEYLPGITLRELLGEHPVLTNDQALDILEAVLAGLAAAHRNGIVHRDLKPENVLLADDGRIKISDFGLARAVTAQTATGNALLGTIAYLSPELVTRGVADARSDIYAVGIMLYEMLAGEQPYKGDQPFQIAQQHANDTVPTPSTKNPRVPVEIDELVLWATARDPEQRPRDARAMLDQVLEVRRLLGEGGGTPAATTMQHTMVLPPAVEPAATGETQVLGTRARARTSPQPVNSTLALARASERRHQRGIWLFVLVLLLAAIAGGTGWYFGAGPGSKVMIPNVSGLEPAVATSELEDLDLVVAETPEQVFSVDVPVGMVAGTDPQIGAAVAHGATVTLLVSQGPEPLPIPELVGQTEEVASQRIADSNFSQATTDYRFDAADRGIVIAALGQGADGAIDLVPGEKYGEQQPVTLVVSLGPVPSVAGMSVDQATATLENVKLKASTAAGLQEFSDDVPAGAVIRGKAPDPPVREGATIELVISKGVQQITVPENIKGMTWGEAEPLLKQAGFDNIEFRDGISEFLSAFPNSVVRSTDPDPGTTVDKGTVVVVRLGAD